MNNWSTLQSISDCYQYNSNRVIGIWVAHFNFSYFWQQRIYIKDRDPNSPSSAVKFSIVINSCSIEFAGSRCKDRDPSLPSSPVNFFVVINSNSCSIEFAGSPSKEILTKFHHRVQYILLSRRLYYQRTMAAWSRSIYIVIASSPARRKSLQSINPEPATNDKISMRSSSHAVNYCYVIYHVSFL